MKPDFDHPPASPIDWCQQWFDEAGKRDTPNPLAMTLSTVDPQGCPSSRIVLLKGFSASGAVFFTNANSQKGKEIAANPHVALLFHWDDLGRQLRLSGQAHEIPASESDDYFASRPRGSQLSAAISEQSTPVESRRELEAQFKSLEQSLEGKSVPRPTWWKGYRVTPTRIEFWQARPDRLHDRVVYELDGAAWHTQRLYP